MVFNPMTSTSASLKRMDISTTTHSISCKNIIPIRHLYTMVMARKSAAITEAMTMMKATVKMLIMLMNWQKRNKGMGVAVTVVLIVIRKKYFHLMECASRNLSRLAQDSLFSTVLLS